MGDLGVGVGGLANTVGIVEMVPVVDAEEPVVVLVAEPGQFRRGCGLDRSLGRS